MSGMSRTARALISHIEKNDPGGLETILLSSINTNYISFFDDGLKDPECRQQLIEFFAHKNGWRKMEDVFAEVYPRDQYRKDLMLKDPHFANPNAKLRYEWDVVQGFCLDLCDTVVLKHDAYIDKDFFGFFFAFRLSKRSNNQVFDFLTFNLIDQFGVVPHKDIKSQNHIFQDYFVYLEKMFLPEYSTLIGPAKANLIMEYISAPQEIRERVKKIIIEVSITPLEDFFIDEHAKQENAAIFRTEVVEKILRGPDGKLLSGAKRLLAEVVYYLFYEKIWKDTLTSKNIAHTLRREIGFPKLNHQGFEFNRLKNKQPSLNIRARLVKIKWKKSH